MFKLTKRLQLSDLHKINVFRTCCQKATKGKLVEKILTPSRTFGQPTHETHPYLLKEDEVTPLLTRTEYEGRRQRLMNSVAAYVTERNSALKHHLIVVPSASKKYMSDKIPYVFRQNTDFLYLSGCLEPDSCLVLAVNESKFTSVLFMRTKDEHSELWDGPRTGPDAAPFLFGVDQSMPMGDFESYVSWFFKTNKNSTLWYDYLTPIQPNVHKTMNDYLNNSGQKMWESPINLIHKQRLFKSPMEVVLMQKTCDVASRAIVKAIRESKPGINEHQIFAKVDYECRMNGADYLAYPPVVAGGNRANTIHYINNNQVVNDGDMVLMDVGCEYHGYTSDITRTWPVNGKFNKQQRELYEIVHKVQSELIDLCKHFPSLDNLFDAMCLSLGKSLQEIGLISKQHTSNDALIRTAYQFCPHHVSHYLGMDVHDTPSITRGINIEPGMVITVEPGIYISHKHKNVPKEYRGLGIRIEDDVHITENGPVVLSRHCPKSITDIEKVATK